MQCRSAISPRSPTGPTRPAILHFPSICILPIAPIRATLQRIAGPPPSMSKSSAAILACCIALAARGIASRAADPAPLSPQTAHDLLHMLDDAFVSVFQKVAPAVVVIEAEKKPSGDDQDQNFDDNFQSPEGGEGAPIPQAGATPSAARAPGSSSARMATSIPNCPRHRGLRENRGQAPRQPPFHRPKLVGVRRAHGHRRYQDRRRQPAGRQASSIATPFASGQMCFAIGIPYNLDYSFCRGIVSAKGRGNLTSSATKPMYEDYIQTDAFINPGNSGGPLFDIDGRVMGMNTLINGIGRGLAFAIPSNMLNDVGPRDSSPPATPPIPGSASPSAPSRTSRTRASASGGIVDEGVCVETIEADAPAYKSDLRAQDIITKVDGVARPHPPRFAARDPAQKSRPNRELEHLARRQDHSKSPSSPRKCRRISRRSAPVPLARPRSTRATPPATASSFPAHPAGRPSPSATRWPAASSSPIVRPGQPGGPRRHPARAISSPPWMSRPSPIPPLPADAGRPPRRPAGPFLFITRGGHKGSAVLDADGSDKQ